MLTIQQIITKLIETLEPLKVSDGVKTITLYEGQLETGEIMQTIDPLPAIYVVYTGSNYINHEARQQQVMQFMFFCVDKCLRNKAGLGIGSISNIGAHKLLDKIRECILNKTLGLELYPFSITSEDIIGYVKGYGIYAATYQTRQAFIAQFL